MKQSKVSAYFIILSLILLTSPQPSLADQQWHYQASAQVAQPGLIETMLQPGSSSGRTLYRQSLVDGLTDVRQQQPQPLGGYHTDSK